MSSSASTGRVGLLVKQELTTYIQSVKCWKDRIIYIDIYLAGHIKLRVVVTYIPMTLQQNKSLRASTIQELKNIINISQNDNYKLIIMGDLNSNHTEYYNLLKDGRSTAKWGLLEYMDQNALVDIHPSSDGKAPSTWEKRCANTGSILQQSRIDGIWVSQDIVTEILHAEIWNS